MKKFKQLVCIGLVLMISLSVCSIAFAAEAITINSATLQKYADETGTEDDSVVNVTVNFTTTNEFGQITVLLASEDIVEYTPESSSEIESKILYIDQIDIPADNTYTFPVVKSQIKAATGLEDIEGCSLYLRMGATDSDPALFVITYHDPSSQVEPPTPQILYGDVNADGNVTPLDKTYLGRYLANWAGYDSKIDIAASDVNADGNVTPLDKTVLGRHLSNWAGYETLPKK